MNDKFQPSAILLEYLADSEPLNCVNYSKERLDKAMEALVQVHSALVVHNDLYPKNILIVPGTPERVVLIDFDVAKIFPTKELLDQDIGMWCPEPMQSCELEIRLLKNFGKHLVCLTLPFKFSMLVSNIVIRRQIKRRDSLPIRSTTEHGHSAVPSSSERHYKRYESLNV